jgi:hypothetical protein
MLETETERERESHINEFLKRPDAILKCLYSPKSENIICGAIKYLNENDCKKQINSLLKAYYLSHTVNFPTRVQNSSTTAIVNIFIDCARLNSPYTAPIINGLSDHDAQFLMINDMNTVINLAPFRWKLRKINNETIAQFQRLLENETWEPVFKNWDPNYKFNSFLDMILRIFAASFQFRIKV